MNDLESYLTNCNLNGLQTISNEIETQLICRPKTKTNNRYFGGLAILCKQSIKPHIKILKNSNPNYQWVKLEKDFFGFKTNLFICCVYDPPSNSSYSKELDHEILGHIEKEIEHFQKRGNVLLCGDFNARVGSENDFIYQDIKIDQG